MSKVPYGVENFNRLSRAHERYRQTTDRRQTDGRWHIANMNLSSRSLKTDRIFIRLDTIPERDGMTDGRTYRRTDIPLASTALCIASNADAL